MKTKKTIFGIILFLSVLIGICNIQNVSADSWYDVEIFPLHYIYPNPYSLEYKDELNLYVSSSGTINVYIMDANQFSTLQNSGGLTWEYYMRWKDITYLEYTYSIQENGVYYVVLYNKNVFFERTVDFQIIIDYYYDYEPVDYIEPDGINYFWILLFYVVIPIVAIILVILIPITLVRRHKRKTPKEPIMA